MQNDRGKPVIRRRADIQRRGPSSVAKIFAAVGSRQNQVNRFAPADRIAIGVLQVSCPPAP
ncbi:hypothetical protein ACFL0M_09795 [Thermodesulfobacteriota bacterium]